MKATFNFDVELVCKLDKYVDNNQPAILCYEKQAIDDGTSIGLYGILTVNLDDGYVDLCNQDADGDWFYQYVDINNWPGIQETLKQCDWCEDAGIELQSGYVKYPLYKFRKEAFDGCE